MLRNFSTIHLSKNRLKFGNATKISAELSVGIKNQPNWKNRQSPVYRQFSPLTTFTHENLKLRYFYFFSLIFV